MKDDFPPLWKGFKGGFSFLVREIRSWGNSTAIGTSSTGEPGVGMWVCLETASSTLGFSPFRNILWKGELSGNCFRVCLVLFGFLLYPD